MGDKIAVAQACRLALRELLNGGVAAARGHAARDEGALAGSEAARAAESARRHADGCAFCAARVRAASKIGAALVKRPAMPATISAAMMLGRIHEAVVDAAEAGPVGELLGKSGVDMPAASEQPQLDQVVGRSAGCVAAGRLAGELVSRPAPLAEGVWSAVRTSILDEVATRTRATSQRWPLVAAALAASIAVAGLAVQMIANSEGTQEPPTIVFTELDAPPDVEFAVLRYGSRR